MSVTAWAPRARQPAQAEAGVRHQSGATVALMLLLLLFLVGPLVMVLAGALTPATDGNSPWALLQQPALQHALWRSLRLAALTAAITVSLAYLYAMALTFSAMPGKQLWRQLAELPLMAPSLLMGIALVYLLGHQGLLRPLWQSLLGETPFYGEVGMVLGGVLWTFPHALLVLHAGLLGLDGRLFEAARTLDASAWQQWRSITWPASRYSVLMAVSVVFVLVVTDFGVAKVVGGQAGVLATELYKQVIGQQNFRTGAVVATLLLIPAVLAFALDAALRWRQQEAQGLRATPLQAHPHRLRDGLAWLYCALVAMLLLGAVAVAIWAALARAWPYDLSLTLAHFRFDDMDGGGWAALGHSLQMACCTAVLGTVLATACAWLTVKQRSGGWCMTALHALATLPLSVPGLVLGLGTILFFNPPWQPLRGLYGSMALMVCCTAVHYLAVAYLTMVTALRQWDTEFDLVAETLGAHPWRTAWTVYLPGLAPTVMEVAGYFFVNAMTTVSAVVFLYTPDNALASIAVLNMDDAGDTAPAAAMAVLILVAALSGRGLLAWGAQRGARHGSGGFRHVA